MSIPFFYIENLDFSQKKIFLNEETSKHIVQVLRMNEGERINLTDGKGALVGCEILEAHKKHCQVKLIDSRLTTHNSRKITIAISLLKNTSRFEWFLEKATEIGVSEIIPLICERTEKEKFRFERMNAILISAMLQSQQCWLPLLLEPVPFNKIIEESRHDQKFIAHCLPDEKHHLSVLVNKNLSSQIILIGPEGDFTNDEIRSAIQNRFIAVSLGETRLRSETAGVVAATLLCID
ncbi:MAG TPA: RsmE family RNA methyltransferase [Chitinophagaceae bacterium]|nr:RsmE family RNA methyltransferase [Chitinophagaceae bacterium]